MLTTQTVDERRLSGSGAHYRRDEQLRLVELRLLRASKDEAARSTLAFRRAAEGVLVQWGRLGGLHPLYLVGAVELVSLRTESGRSFTP